MAPGECDAGTQIFSITLTANHFFLDASPASSPRRTALALAVERWVYPWIGDRLRDSPMRGLVEVKEDPRKPAHTSA
jgi:hypothetical protein